jgi:hypothetical protein
LYPAAQVPEVPPLFVAPRTQLFIVAAAHSVALVVEVVPLPVELVVEVVPLPVELVVVPLPPVPVELVVEPLPPVPVVPEDAWSLPPLPQAVEEAPRRRAKPRKGRRASKSMAGLPAKRLRGSRRMLALYQDRVGS